MSDETRRGYDVWAESYDAEPNPHTRLEREDVLRAVDAGDGDRILDAACGTGMYARAFARAGAEVVGLDFSEKMLEVARRKVPTAEFVAGDLRDPLPFEDETFDTVNCAQAMKHLPNLDGVVGAFGRVVRSGGRVVFSVVHPDMNWEGYEPSGEMPGARALPERSEMFDYAFSDYYHAIERAGLTLEDVRHVRVDERIEPLLTPESYRVVEGRRQIAIFRSRKE